MIDDNDWWLWLTIILMIMIDVNDDEDRAELHANQPSMNIHFHNIEHLFYVVFWWFLSWHDNCISQNPSTVFLSILSHNESSLLRERHLFVLCPPTGFMIYAVKNSPESIATLCSNISRSPGFWNYLKYCLTIHHIYHFFYTGRIF